MKKGFTLIELLVVIAIIGILASIVLVSLGTARNKAKDSAIKAELAGLRASAEMYASDHSEAYMSTTAPIHNFCTDTTVNGGDRIFNATTGSLHEHGATNYDCNAASDKWAACAQLLGDTGTTGAYCVDWTGSSKAMTRATCVTSWTGTTCP